MVAEAAACSEEEDHVDGAVARMVPMVAGNEDVHGSRSSALSCLDVKAWDGAAAVVRTSAEGVDGGTAGWPDVHVWPGVVAGWTGVLVLLDMDAWPGAAAVTAEPALPQSAAARPGKSPADVPARARRR